MRMRVLELECCAREGGEASSSRSFSWKLLHTCVLNVEKLIETHVIYFFF